MAENDNKSNPEQEQPKFNQDQYEMLKRCSKKGDITEWNNRRKENPGEEIWLQGADLMEDELQGANLMKANLQGARLGGARLQGAQLLESKLLKSDILMAKLQGADFSRAIVDGETLIWDCEVDRKTKGHL